MPELDELDAKILRSLNKDARKSLRDIARELGVSLTTVWNHIRKLEERQVIQGYIPLINPGLAGFSLVVIIGVRIAHGKLVEVQQRIGKDPRVFAVYDVTGDWDSVCVARFHDREELNAFIKEVLSQPHVERTNTMLVLNTIKEEKRVMV